MQHTVSEPRGDFSSTTKRSLRLIVSCPWSCDGESASMIVVPSVLPGSREHASKTCRTNDSRSSSCCLRIVRRLRILLSRAWDSLSRSLRIDSIPAAGVRVPVKALLRLFAPRHTLRWYSSAGVHGDSSSLLL